MPDETEKRHAKELEDWKAIFEGEHEQNNLKIEKRYQHPEPIRPREGYLIPVLLLAAALIRETESLYLMLLAVLCVGWVLYLWHQDQRAYQLARLEHLRANSQRWVNYFKRRQEEGVPWFHGVAMPEDADGREVMATADEGVANWEKYVAELEQKLAFMKSRWWRVFPPSD